MPKKPSSHHVEFLGVIKAHAEGVTEGEIRNALGIPTDERRRTDRRIRELRQWYHIEGVRRGRSYYYVYRGDRDDPLDAEPINQRIRAIVLSRAHGRCERYCQLE